MLEILLGLMLVGGVLATGEAKPPATVEPPLLTTVASDLPLLMPPGPALRAPGCGPSCGPGCALPLLPPPPPPLIDPPAPHVTVKVRVAACSPLGRDLEYRICLENASPAAAHHVLLRNPLPANATFVKAIPEPTRTTPEIQWELGTMFAGERRTIVLILSPTGAGEVHNCTRVQFEHGQCVTTRIKDLEDGIGPELLPKPRVVPIPKVIPTTDGKISLSITGPAKQYINLPAQYFLKVTNTGKITARKVQVVAQLPDKLEYQDATLKGIHIKGQVSWVVGDLEPGQSKTVELVVKATASGNHCVKGAAIADPNLHDKAEACTDFRGVSSLAPGLGDKNDPLVVGGETTYTIRVDEIGGSPASNVQIRAFISDLLSFQGAKGGQFKLSEARSKEGEQILTFDPVSLPAGGKLELEVTVRAVRAGDARFKIDLTADQLDPARGPVRTEETTSLFNEDGPPRKQ